MKLYYIIEESKYWVPTTKTKFLEVTSLFIFADKLFNSFFRTVVYGTEILYIWNVSVVK